MNRYFAKYLPTIGKLYKDCQAFRPDNKRVRVNEACLKNLVTPEWRLAKLFLCSRDINVGDIFKSEELEVKDCTFICKESNEYDVTAEDKRSCSGITIFSKRIIFKVIGEILTPGILEGKEFTEKEVEYLTLKL